MLFQVAPPSFVMENTDTGWPPAAPDALAARPNQAWTTMVSVCPTQAPNNGSGGSAPNSTLIGWGATLQWPRKAVPNGGFSPMGDGRLVQLLPASFERKNAPSLAKANT